jgi:hypothetical protein
MAASLKYSADAKPKISRFYPIWKIINVKCHFKKGAVKTTYAFSAFLTPFPSNFHFAWYQQAGEGGSYDTLAERYGERIRCFTLTPLKIV